MPSERCGYGECSSDAQEQIEYSPIGKTVDYCTYHATVVRRYFTQPVPRERPLADIESEVLQSQVNEVSHS